MISSGLNSCVGRFCESKHNIMVKFQTDPDHEESQREGRQVVGILNGGAVERKVGVKTNPLPFSYWAALSCLRVETLTNPGDVKKSINILIQLQGETYAGWCTAPLTLRTRLFHFLVLEILKNVTLWKIFQSISYRGGHQSQGSPPGQGCTSGSEKYSILACVIKVSK